MIESEIRQGTSKLFFAWVTLLAIVSLAGLYGGYVVITEGLIVTGMSNMVAWGLWIAADLSFIALSAGAFTISSIIYVFKVESLRTVGRTAVFVGLVGYTMTMLTLVLDIGRPERFWFPLLYWNETSVLLEVFWCIMMYMAVLTGEIVPTLADTRLRRIPILPPLSKILHTLMPALVTAGAVFSMLHQSSLGALYGVLVGRPLWYGPELPLVFLVSAIASGPSLTILALIVTSRIGKRQLVETAQLSKLAKILGAILVVYLILRAYDVLPLFLSPTNLQLELLTLLANTPHVWTMWVFELATGAAIPAVIFLTPRLQRSTRALFVGSGLVVVGLVVSRWNVTITGLLASDLPPAVYVKGAPMPLRAAVLGSYVPTWPEWITVVGVIAFGFLVFSLGVKYLPLFVSKAEGGADKPVGTAAGPSALKK